MSDQTPQPLFLEQRSYRQRRVRDVARVLPVIGTILWIFPLLWPRTGMEAATTGYAAQFIFGVWIFLIILSAFVSRAIQSEEGEANAPE